MIDGHDDGGSAFPTPETESYNPDPGMTLLDYFAIHSKEQLEQDMNLHKVAKMAGMDPPPDIADEAAWFLWWTEAEARLRYIQAEAMIKEKRRREGGGVDPHAAKQ